jgi:hypothetical protein
MVDPMKPDGPAPRARPPYTRRQVVSQVAIAAVILVSGIGIGTGGTILVMKDRIMWRPPFRSNGGDRRPPIDPIEMWKTEYGLTDDQARQAKEAFAASWASTRKIFEETGQKMEAEQGKFAESIKAIFTPDQYEKWEQDFKARAERMRRWRPGPGGGPGVPGGPPGGHKDGRRDRSSFRGDRGFQPPPGREPPPGEPGFPPSPNLPGNPESSPKPE